MSSAASFFAVGALTLAFAGLVHCAPVRAEDDALAQQLRHQMAELVRAPTADERDGPVILSDGRHAAAPVIPAASWDLAGNTALPPAPSDDRKVGGFKWNARPTFQPVVAARDPSSATPFAPSSFDPPSFDPLADPLPTTDARKKDANFRMTFSEPSYTDVTAEAQPLAPEAEPAESSVHEERGGPVNFPIGKSVKIKAQPLGGGLGGRVTFIFTLPTGD